MSVRLKLLGIAAASLAFVGSADAATYVGTRTIGTGSVNLSITTDGTIGALGNSNISSYTIDLINTDGTFTLNQGNSAVLITGGLSATATQLLFDFGSTGFALFQAPGIGSSQTFYCLQVSACYQPATPGEAVEATTDYVYQSVARSGIQVIASTGVTPVPEPATWGMMLVGLGAIGFGLRSRRRSSVTTRIRFA